MTDENNNLVCDECGDALPIEVYILDMEGCYCVDCALHFAREKLTNSNECRSISIDKESADHYLNDIEFDFCKARI